MRLEGARRGGSGPKERVIRAIGDRPFLYLFIALALSAFAFLSAWTHHRQRQERPSPAVASSLPLTKPVVLTERELGGLRREYRFVILVYAWKRRASLKRLCDSLRAAYYHGFDVRLEFHVEGDPHPLVMQYVDRFDWPHGPKLVNRRHERVGLERAIMHSWLAPDDHELALMFEDDIEVSPLYFEYVLLLLHRYHPRPPQRARAVDALAGWTVGVGLTTPRFNEVNIPHRYFQPDALIRQHPVESMRNATVYAHQLPCSWGSLYFPWEWRRFHRYWQWRRTSQSPPEDLGTVPHGYVNTWRRSWKRYLVEYMLLEGKAMLYGSLPRQLSFSTHHREPGEHTAKKNAATVGEVPIVDDLTVRKNRLFTVPLANDASHLRAVAEHLPASLQRVPVVNFYHELVGDWPALRQTGLPVRETMRHWLAHNQTAWQAAGLEVPEPACMLDFLEGKSTATPPPKRRFLTFVPRGDFVEQTLQLAAAQRIAQLLQRELLVPKMRVPASNDDGVDFGELFAGVHSNATANVAKPARTVRVRALSERGLQVAATDEAVSLPMPSADADDVVRWLGACGDAVLAIDGAHILMVPVAAPSLLDAWQHVRWLSAEQSLTCVDATALGDRHECWRLKLRADKDSWLRPYYTAHCSAHIGPLVSRLLANDTAERVVYVIDDASRPVVGVRDGRKDLRVLQRRSFVLQQLPRAGRGAGGRTARTNSELAKVLEAHMCAALADDVYGSAYSWATQLMQLWRPSARPVRRLDGSPHGQ